jgi:replication-associated recombination protein RarA
MRFTTKKGYGFFEASSAFQKAIRRNDEKIALYFMVEFFNSGYDQYVWKRIKQITSEDIGLAEPSMIATVAALHSSYDELKKDNKDNKPERLYLVHAVTMLCRAKKSRLLDWAMIKLWREHDTLEVPVPDWAQDMHTLKGKSMGRSLQHFYNEGTNLANHEEQPGEAQMKAEAWQLHQLTPGKMKFEPIKKGTMTQQNAMFENE